MMTEVDIEKRKQYQRAYYLANPDKFKKYRDDNWYKNRKPKYERRKYWLSKYKVAKGCQSCGYNKSPVALDFDHTEDNKIAPVGTMLSNYKLKVVFKEIRKCTLLCSNCHRIITYDRKKNDP